MRNKCKTRSDGRDRNPIPSNRALPGQGKALPKERLGRGVFPRLELLEGLQPANAEKLLEGGRWVEEIDVIFIFVHRELQVK